MASNMPYSSIVRTCYNCGDPGHFVKWCPHPKPANPQSAIVPSHVPLLTLASNSVSNPNVVASTSATGQFPRGFGRGQTKQGMDYLEHTLAEIKIRHESEIEKEKNLKAEEEKNARETAEEERREAEKGDREEFRKQLTDSMNIRLDGVVDLLRSKGGSSEVEALRREVERLGGRNVPVVALTSSTQATIHDNDGLLAKMMAEQERMKNQLEQALQAKQCLEVIEKEMNEVIRARDEDRADAEKWQQEALCPGKRGCINLTTPAAKTLFRPSTSTPLKSPVASVDLKRISDMHRLKVETIQEMRIRDFNARREAEQDLEKAKEKIAQLEHERVQKTPRSNLHARMEEVCTTKGKGKHAVEKAVPDDKEKEMFAKEERKALRGLMKDALVEICEREGVKYAGVKQAVDDIVAHRGAATIEVSEDLAEGVNDKASGGDSVS
ncbi:hypothetical protein CBR_g30896 [Chara braunii]|uniref:CCHC-type domain-containing protein n=1 Tax=Chara braunii TaxID=69332 RepID=A0A388LDP8_CHABU|nr:hypothetical protein CBR_g30896 [Chara braunii]|eukprot:GBG80431.1 hypothetical protein CBR_g30896 [Chara braunii]